MKKLRDILLFEDSSIVSFLLNFVFSVSVAIGLAFGSMMNPYSVYDAEKSSEVLAEQAISDGLEWIEMHNAERTKENKRQIFQFRNIIGNGDSRYGDRYFLCYDWNVSGIDFQYVFGSYENEDYHLDNRNIMISKSVFQDMKKDGAKARDGSRIEVDEANVIGLIIYLEEFGERRITGVYDSSSFDCIASGYNRSIVMTGYGLLSESFPLVASYLKNPSKNNLTDILKKTEIRYTKKDSQGRFEDLSLESEMNRYPETGFYYVFFFYLLFVLGVLSFAIKEIYDVFDFYHSYKREEIGIRRFFLSDLKKKGAWFVFALTGYLILYLCLFFNGDHLLVSVFPSLISSISILLGLYFVFVLLVHALGCFIREGMKKD